MDAKVYNDLLRLNASIDRLTLEIVMIFIVPHLHCAHISIYQIQSINVDFIFELPKPMMDDILNL
jgi:uncharacterized membrane protein YwzB